MFITTLLAAIFSWVTGVSPDVGFHLECRQIGDGQYSCDGGTR